MNTLIKICGITKPEEAILLNELKIDFAGMVLFFEKSKRNISISQAKKILQILSPKIKAVAVVVSPDLEQLLLIQEAGFDYVQIHGSLPDGIWDSIQIPVIKAFNITDLEHFSSYNNIEQIKGFVFDSKEPGSGQTFDWNLLKQLPSTSKFILLAGGLNSENVCEAITLVKPDGVDVSSAVEYTDRPGKDPEKVRHFVASVRKEF